MLVFAAFSLLLRLPLSDGAFLAGPWRVCHIGEPHIDRVGCNHCPFVTALGVGSQEETIDTTNTDDPSTTRRRLGLLRGVDLEVDSYYADEIDMSKEGLAWLSQSGLMWEAATKDAAAMGIPVDKYVEEVKANMTSFAKSGIAYDRKELSRYVNNTLFSKGALTLLLGGKNVGKTVVLRSLAKDYGLNNTSSSILVLYVNARLAPFHLETGIANAVVQLVAQEFLKKPDPVDWINLLKNGTTWALGTAFSNFLAPTGNIKPTKTQEEGLQAILEIVANAVFDVQSANTARASKTLVEKFIEIAEAKSKFPVLIIDEANMVLGIENAGGKLKSQTLSLLSNFVAYSKESRRMNVILASSEYAYPYRLEREGFNLQNIKKVIFAGEIPPKDMWTLLVNAKYKEGDKKDLPMIGMGPHLAEICLAAYGGHFWNVQCAVEELASEQDRVKVSTFLPALGPKILRCLDTNWNTRPLLEAMAKYGFAPVRTPDNPAAEVITKENVGGVVNTEAACIGIPVTKWEETKFRHALITSSKCVRLGIAMVLLNEESPTEESPTKKSPTLFKWIRNTLRVTK